jgi:hypothetical protein
MQDNQDASMKALDRPRASIAACFFSDSFHAYERDDGMYLLELMCNYPEGLQTNARTMLSRKSLERLHIMLGRMLDRKNGNEDQA